jgi:heme A synthase
MILGDPLLVFLVGFFGGVSAEVLRWYGLRTADKLPKYASSPLYWIASIVMALVSGMLPLFYGLNSAIAVFHVGISTPIILKQMALSAPKNR